MVAKRLLVVSVLVCICCVMLCCTKSSDNNKEDAAGTIAMAGSVSVTTEDFTQALMTMSGPQQFEYLSDKGRHVLLDMLLDWKLLAQEALKEGIDKKTEVKKALRQTTGTVYERDQVLGSAYLRWRIKQLQPVSDKQVEDYYDKNIHEFNIVGRTRVQRIVFAKEERAQAALKQLQQGMDFAQYKKQYAEQRITVDTVWLQRTERPSDFENEIKILKTGETSGIIKTKSGPCIARVLERTPALTLSFKDVRERIYAQLQDRNERELIANIRQSLRQDIAIEMNNNLLESYQCDECGAGKNNQTR
jgi:peptidyl-prolyl cis-trans isomerase C